MNPFLHLLSTRRRIVAMLILASLCIAQLAAFVVAQPIAERRTLRGRIMGDNNLPIGGAAVTVRRVGSSSAGFWGTVVYTDARGHFVVPEAEEGAYSVLVEAKNYARLNGKAYELNASSLPIEAVLQRLASFNVRVQGSDGKPLANTTVSILLHQLDNQGTRTLRSNTDAKGELTVSDVTPARHILYAVASGRGFDLIPKIDLLPGLRPEPLNLALQAGGTLKLTARETATGMAAADGRALGGATLTLQVKSDDQRTSKLNLESLFGDERARQITSDTDGTIELTDVPPGLYSALLMHRHYGNTAREVTVGVPRDVAIKAQETTNADFWLPRPADAQVSSLRVLVQDAQTQPVSGANVFITLEQLSGAIDLNQAGVIGFAQRRALTDDKGRFELYPLPVGNWRVRLYGTSLAAGAGAKSKNFVSSEPVAVKLAAEGASLTISVK